MVALDRRVGLDHVVSRQASGEWCLFRGLSGCLPSLQGSTRSSVGRDRVSGLSILTVRPQTADNPGAHVQVVTSFRNQPSPKEGFVFSKRAQFSCHSPSARAAAVFGLLCICCDGFRNWRLTLSPCEVPEQDFCAPQWCPYKYDPALGQSIIYICIRAVLLGICWGLLRRPTYCRIDLSRGLPTCPGTAGALLPDLYDG